MFGSLVWKQIWKFSSGLIFINSRMKICQWNHTVHWTFEFLSHFKSQLLYFKYRLWWVTRLHFWFVHTIHWNFQPMCTDLFCLKTLIVVTRFPWQPFASASGQCSEQNFGDFKYTRLLESLDHWQISYQLERHIEWSRPIKIYCPR